MRGGQMVRELARALAWLTARERELQRQHRPIASAWTEVWSEYRIACVPAPTGMTWFARCLMHTTNRRTKKMTEKTLFAGSGESPGDAVRDLHVQMRHGIPAAFVDETAFVMPAGAWPLGLFGGAVVEGQA